MGGRGSRAEGEETVLCLTCCSMRSRSSGVVAFDLTLRACIAWREGRGEGETRGEKRQ